VAGWSYDIALEVSLQPGPAAPETIISRSNFRHLYWTMAQQLAHHTVTGCNMRPGDLLASGTISGPTPDSYGSMLELAWKGTRPLALTGGAQRRFLEDGDCVTFRAEARAAGHRIGFGECRGTILPAVAAAG
jgi:fumarylacetoacetase